MESSFGIDLASASATNLSSRPPFAFITSTPKPPLPASLTPDLEVDVLLPEALNTSTLSKIGSDPKSLTALATLAHMATATIPEAKRLYERLLDALRAMPQFENWDLAFANLLTMRDTLERRTAQAMVELLVDAPGEQRTDVVKALVHTASNARFDGVLQSRLDAIAQMPPGKRLAAWRSTFASCQRSDGYYDTSRANRLAAGIAHLPQGEQRAATSALLANAGNPIRGTGWGELVETCAKQASSNGTITRWEVLKEALDASSNAGDAAVKEAIAEAMRHLERCPPDGAQALLAMAVQMTTLEGDYEHLGFNDFDAISLLRDLRDTSSSDKRAYPRPDFATLIRQQLEYAAD
ncbi:hypothetical protein ACPWR0_22850 [Pandoraea pneumonica]|uniref:hypothetical protein n=1 Tax=Pandoraea pneumonica TaxID=2508299 RepID=UPI003CF86CFB